MLAVITEWVDGRPWSEILQTSVEPQEAVIVAYELAQALQAGHAAGVTHGRLRPSSVLITSTNQVRLRGLAVDAALYGVAPGDDPVAADLHGVGAMLYAGLTGRWPCTQQDGAVDRLRVIGPVGGILPAAGEVVAGVPSDLDQLADSCLLPALRPRVRYRTTTIDQAVLGLSRAMNRLAGRGGATPVRAAGHRYGEVLHAPGDPGHRLHRGGHRGGVRRQSHRPVADRPSRPLPYPPSLSAQPVPISIAGATDFDPDGADHTENPQLVPLAIDGGLDTAWRTVRYRTSNMTPKSGTGLVLDLGLSRPIGAVRLDLLGSGTTVEVRASETLGGSATDYESFARAVAAPARITLRAPIPVQARYVLVWLTNLPFQGQDGTYAGGLREVKVFG